jgi:hypothetical protein
MFSVLCMCRKIRCDGKIMKSFYQKGFRIPLSSPRRRRRLCTSTSRWAAFTQPFLHVTQDPVVRWGRLRSRGWQIRWTSSPLWCTIEKLVLPSPYLKFPWCGMEGEVLRVDLDTGCQVLPASAPHTRRLRGGIPYALALALLRPLAILTRP